MLTFDYKHFHSQFVIYVMRSYEKSVIYWK